MSTTLQIAEALGVVILGLSSTWFSQRAATRSKATSNGWTAGLGRRLDRQDAILTRIEEKIDGHVRDHAFPRAPRTVHMPPTSDKD